jgi:zinc protease
LIPFKKHILHNGLTLIVHHDRSTPVTGVSVLYKVGSRDESPDKTGLAHLFEHLMFGGSKHVKDFDTPIQNAGGENNAWTNNDQTNFYCVLPAENIDTALWLESDRMAALQLTQKKLDNEKKVVIEEFKETCLNEPYGDVWHHISDLVYTVHPYRWPVIGLNTAQIAGMKLEDATSFYERFYQPSNAIISIAGPLSFKQVLQKVRYWFEDIPGRPVGERKLPTEPAWIGRRFREVIGDVPSDALYMMFPMTHRMSPEYYYYDLLSDILGGARSSRLYQALVKEKEIFTYIDAYITGTVDEGILLIEGKVAPGITIQDAETSVWDVLHKLRQNPIGKRELQKLKNKVESSLVFSESNVMHKAVNLAVFEALGDPELINREVAMYRAVSSDDLFKIAEKTFNEENVAVLYYLKEK